MGRQIMLDVIMPCIKWTLIYKMSILSGNVVFSRVRKKSRKQIYVNLHQISYFLIKSLNLRIPLEYCLLAFRILMKT